MQKCPNHVEANASCQLCQVARFYGDIAGIVSELKTEIVALRQDVADLRAATTRPSNTPSDESPEDIFARRYPETMKWYRDLQLPDLADAFATVERSFTTDRIELPRPFQSDYAPVSYIDNGTTTVTTVGDTGARIVVGLADRTHPTYETINDVPGARYAMGPLSATDGIPLFAHRWVSNVLEAENALSHLTVNTAPLMDAVRDFYGRTNIAAGTPLFIPASGHPPLGVWQYDRLRGTSARTLTGNGNSIDFGAASDAEVIKFMSERDAMLDIAALRR